MFLFKKVFSRLLFPVPLCSEILVIGLILLSFRRSQKAGRIVVSCGVVLLLLLSSGPAGDYLLGRLEREFPPLVTTSEGFPAFNYVVVLSGGASSAPDIPLSSQLSGESLARLVEGVGLHKKLAGSKLVLSGGSLGDPVAEAEIMARVALLLGVSQQDIVLESRSRDTEEEARFLQPLLQTQPFILVTSAAHMPRAMALFRKAGTKPVPAPTGYLTKQQGSKRFDYYYPGLPGLSKTSTAVYEYLGLAWAKLRGRI